MRNDLYKISFTKYFYDMCFTECRGKVVRTEDNIKLTIEAIIPVMAPFLEGDNEEYYLLAKPDDSNYSDVPFLVFEIKESTDPQIDSYLSPLVNRDKLSLVLAIYDAATELKTL